MKLLHLSDWHLGRTTYGEPRAPDHDEVIAEIERLAREEKPDLVIHTGDLFDGVRPPYAEIRRGLEALQELAAVAPVVVVAGNHDSAALFRIFRQLLGDGSRIHFVDKARKPADGGVLDFDLGGERARVAALPFVHANRAVDAFEEPGGWTAAYADRIARIENRLLEGLQDGYHPSRDVLLFAAHLHVAGARFSGSERQIHVSEDYATRLEHVPTVSYAAFGHIHRPQKVPGTTPGRYAGSPIQLDFGEVGEEKQVVLVEAIPAEPPRIREIPLRGGRPLRKLEGTLDGLRLEAPEVGRELCLVTVHGEEPIPDLSDQLRDLLPEATLLQVREVCSSHRLEVVEEPDAPTPEPSFEELFRGYLGERGTRDADADRVLDAFSTLLAAARNEEEPRFDEEKLLDEEQLVEVEAAAGPGEERG